jgi:hypothetical protein
MYWQGAWYVLACQLKDKTSTAKEKRALSCTKILGFLFLGCSLVPSHPDVIIDVKHKKPRRFDSPSSWHQLGAL